MAKRQWKLQDAKSRFSEVVELAIKVGPQEVTRRGQPAVVVIAHKEFLKLGKKRRKGSFAALIRSSPLMNEGLDLSRQQDQVRSTDGLFD